MKRFLLLTLILAGMSSFCNAQDVKVNINNQDATVTDDCAYRINGICSSEDIGGVDVEMFYNNGVKMRLTNYNSFPVTVLWSLEYKRNTSDHNGEKKTGNTVLGVSGQKEIFISDANYYYSSNWSLEGLIVRKISQ